ETELVTKSDGTAKNSHHVVDAAGSAITCESMTSSAIGKGTEVESITMKPKYSNCTWLGLPATVQFYSCHLVFTASGEVHIQTDSAAGTGKTCAEDPITWTVSSPTCVVTTPPQTIANSATYTNIKPESFNEITLSTNAMGIFYTAAGVGCPETG